MKAITATARGMLKAGTALSLVMFHASPAWAQEATSPSPPEQPAPVEATAAATTDVPAAALEDSDGEVVVTAQRRAERLSRVPVSVVAFDAETLQERLITSEQDVGTLVPGLQVKNGQNSNQLSFSMRGQSLDPFSGTSPAVLTYLNEAPYNPGNTATAFFDLESIQVLKGPQGTLFGRNATGGAVLYSTPIPGSKVAGYVNLRGGSRDYFQIQAAADLPMVNDVLALRLAFDITRGDGYVKNLNTGNTLGDKDSQAGRATLLFTPTDALRNVTIVQYDRARGTEGAGNIKNYNSTPAVPGDPSTQFNSDGTNHFFNTTGVLWDATLFAIYGANDGPAAPGFFPGGPEGYTRFSHENPYKTWLQYDLPHRANNFFASNTTEFDVADNVKIKNIASYMNGKANTPGNLGGGPFGSLWLFKLSGINATGAPGGQTFRSKTFTNELQVQGTSTDSRLDYTAGVFYSRQRRFEIIPINIGSDLGLPAPIADISYAYRNRESSKAIFAQASYKVTDQLTATLGGRYTWVTVGIKQAPGNVFGVDPESDAAKQSKKLSAPSWTASLQYQIDRSNMVYFNQRGSFRSGNLNGTVAPFTDPLTGRPANLFKNEKVHDFEIGYKFSGDLGAMPAQFNIAAYKVIVKDAQRALYAVVGGAPAGFTVNVPEAVTKGIEVDTNIDLTHWLQVGVNLAYTDAKYTKGEVPIPFVGTLTVDSYPDSPKWAGSANVTARLPVSAELGEMDLRADYYGQTHTFFSSTNGSSTPGTRLDGYSTIGLRFGWREIMRSKFSAALFVRNLTDKVYHVSGYALGASNGVNTWYPGEPRTFGAEVSVKF